MAETSRSSQPQPAWVKTRRRHTHVARILRVTFLSLIVAPAILILIWLFESPRRLPHDSIDVVTAGHHSIAEVDGEYHTPVRFVADRRVDHRQCLVADWPSIPLDHPFPSGNSNMLQDIEVQPASYGQATSHSPDVKRLLLPLVVTALLILLGSKLSAVQPMVWQGLYLTTLTISLLGCSSWAATQYIVNRSSDQDFLERYVQWSESAKTVYSIMWPLTWARNPWPTINANITNAGIAMELAGGDVAGAIRFANNDEHLLSEQHRAVAYHMGAINAYEHNDTDRAFELVRKFLRIEDPDHTSGLAQGMYTAIAYQYAVNRMFSQAASVLAHSQISWDDSSYDLAWASVLGAELQMQQSAVPVRALNISSLELELFSSMEELLEADLAFGHAMHIFDSSNEYWSDEIADSAWMSNLTQTLRTMPTNASADAMLAAVHANITGRYLVAAASSPKARVPDSVACLYASQLDEIAHADLAAGNTVEAEKYATVAHNIVSGSPSTMAILSITELQKGVDLFYQGDVAAAIAVLSEASSRDPSNAQIQCTLSQAIMVSAINHAHLSLVDKALSLANEARSLCRFSGFEKMNSELHLALGRQYLQQGEFSLAAAELLRVAKGESLTDILMARTLIEDIPDARDRIRKIQHARSWVEHLPGIKGSTCVLSAESPTDCSVVHLYGGQHANAIGSARPDLSEAHFPLRELKDVTLTVRDSTGSGIIDTAIHEESNTLRIVSEIDNDGLIDAQERYVGGVRVEDTAYSGRIMVWIPSAVVASVHDFLSAPDPYLAIVKNNGRPCWTEVARNTNFPTYRTQCSVHFRKGDRLDVYMYDEDYNEHDFIDGFVFHTLPESGIYRNGITGNAGIEMHVSESRVPEGAYLRPETELVNVFEFGRDFDQPMISSMIAKARKYQTRSDQMAKVASFVLPELAVMAFLGSQRFAVQVFASIAGSATMHSELVSE